MKIINNSVMDFVVITKPRKSLQTKFVCFVKISECCPSLQTPPALLLFALFFLIDEAELQKYSTDPVIVFLLLPFKG